MGGHSYTANLLSGLKNSSDKTIFMRHGDIRASVSIELKAIRDLNNVLELMKPNEYEEFIF